ncbi:hypothetical protein WAI453_006209 [Rhynchosporium graminicola]
MVSGKKKRESKHLSNLLELNKTENHLKGEVIDIIEVKLHHMVLQYTDLGNPNVLPVEPSRERDLYLHFQHSSDMDSSAGKIYETCVQRRWKYYKPSLVNTSCHTSTLISFNFYLANSLPSLAERIYHECKSYHDSYVLCISLASAGERSDFLEQGHDRHLRKHAKDSPGHEKNSIEEDVSRYVSNALWESRRSKYQSIVSQF